MNAYIYYFFSSEGLDHSNIGNKAFGKSLNSKFLKNDVMLPLPPISIQQQIVDECAKVDEEYESSRMAIEEYRNRITQIFIDLEVLKNTKQGGG